MIQLKHITTDGAELNIVRHLFTAYAKELNVDLCFQGFDEELKMPLKKYGAPKGSLLLAYYDGEPAGTIALQALAEEGVCEMKRLYVSPDFRKAHIGEQLVDALLADAQKLGYTKMKLDTLDRLQPAIQLYLRKGFVVTTAYYPNPLPGVVYMEKLLFS
ncbi:MAG: GNAT family N-acetyltransferase [Sediminibacterium sp.]|jgi:putative acetyltransferase|nr:GNAT family N-acetyltransferase [Chitinophagaceae bacterium]MCA6447236.1 GNAT family N-acetyltransferase [Chitinophagaceae bacterium]